MEEAQFTFGGSGTHPNPEQVLCKALRSRPEILQDRCEIALQYLQRCHGRRLWRSVWRSLGVQEGELVGKNRNCVGEVE